MNLFALSAKTSGFLVENFWQECQNCNLLVQRKFVKKNDILKKNVFEKSYFLAKFSNFDDIFPSRLSKLHSAQLKDFMKCFFFEKSIVLWTTWDFAQKFAHFWKKSLRQGCENCFLYVKIKLFGYLISFWKVTRLQIFSEIHGENFRQVCQNLILSAQRIIGKIFWMNKVSMIFFGFRGKTSEFVGEFWQEWQSCILHL